jgi:cysteine-rich repeat protein
VHGIDTTTSGISQPMAQVRSLITGFPSPSSIVIADDDATEFFSSGAGSYTGAWRFLDNTDGAVVTGLTLPGSWTVNITTRFESGIRAYRWVNEPSAFTSFSTATEPVILQAYPTPSMCRRDCTVPRCGDGRLDGGEVCDDGNTSGGDDCSADCRRVPG